MRRRGWMCSCLKGEIVDCCPSFVLVLIDSLDFVAAGGEGIDEDVRLGFKAVEGGGTDVRGE